MKRFVEITGKVGEFTYPPHTYYLNKAGKLAGFKVKGEEEIKWYTKPLTFDRRRRLFKELPCEFEG